LIVWVQEWEESERGWGTRPDGYSIHLSEKAADDYVTEHWRSESKKRGPGGPTPDIYSRDEGNPFKAEIVAKDAGEDVLVAVLAGKAIRVYSKPKWLKFS
jgi:hypothetical protein